MLEDRVKRCGDVTRRQPIVGLLPDTLAPYCAIVYYGALSHAWRVEISARRLLARTTTGDNPKRPAPRFGNRYSIAPAHGSAGTGVALR